ncbi:uncharacterized protein SPSK_07825 [Sporothrix schenckii 1099-18]|uniref:IBR domain-containing protein n=2 Tax=Sporothrix schenckii TaxID=29908 RepID=U7Q171_SPOS1|nr:uncharacterized protein SPSK_07825 [Sporothrix schenckii 1099-18]ERT01654.1 hypothetical protein HMPREF1624_02906 [Sporothrix schenckii ATCC 58251]KJR88881.1 hypothetical protein SPSK_07825 [Sporothrix schenckii 1099-18]
MSKVDTRPIQLAASPSAQSLRDVTTAASAASATSSSTLDTAHSPPSTCFVCLEPCVAGSAASLRTRQDVQALVCRLTVNGVRVPHGAPFTSVVRGDYYARPSAFDCHACGASVCCLCLCRCLRAGIQYVARHPLTCACGDVPLINASTVLFLSAEQTHQLYLRCDEWFCADPLYCPEPTCSAYLPMLPCLHGGREHDKGDKGDRKTHGKAEGHGRQTARTGRTDRTRCVRCDVPVCTQCKGRADDAAHRADDRVGAGNENEIGIENVNMGGPPVPCTRPNVHWDKEVERVIQEKGYRKWYVRP